MLKILYHLQPIWKGLQDQRRWMDDVALPVIHKRERRCGRCNQWYAGEHACTVSDANISRPLPHTFTGLQWAAILHTLSIGVETIRNMAGDASQLDERWRIAEQEVLPELRQLVASAREIEASGRGLDHPTRAHWVRGG